MINFASLKKKLKTFSETRDIKSESNVTQKGFWLITEQQNSIYIYIYLDSPLLVLHKRITIVTGVKIKLQANSNTIQTGAEKRGAPLVKLHVILCHLKRTNCLVKTK